RPTTADRQAQLLSCSFGGSISNLFGTLLSGGELHLYDVRQRGVAGLAQWLVDQRISIYHSVPTIFRRMLRHAPPGLTFPAMRLVKLGGEPVTRRDVDLFDAHFAPHCILRHAFGSTEAYIPTTYQYQRG